MYSGNGIFLANRFLAIYEENSDIDIVDIMLVAVHWGEHC